jgi:hypothetical protein
VDKNYIFCRNKQPTPTLKEDCLLILDSNSYTFESLTYATILPHLIEQCTPLATISFCNVNVGICANDGQCIDVGSKDYVCACRVPFQGKRCQISSCTDDIGTYIGDQLCPRNRRCIPNTDVETGYYQCDCANGLGPDCITDPCSISQCQNGGQCRSFIDADGSANYVCNCAVGTSGNHCQFSVCPANACNGGGCIPESSSTFVCQCPLGRTGPQCETDSCIQNPCQNGGTCTGTITGYKCICPDRFSGVNCEVFTPSCNPALNPCKNGAGCAQWGDKFFCSCQEGSSGELCDQTRCTAEPDLCQGHGMCSYTPTPPYFYCTCETDEFGNQAYGGTFCQCSNIECSDCYDSNHPCYIYGASSNCQYICDESVFF